MRHIIPFAIMLLLASCGSKQAETQDTIQPEQNTDEVRTLPDYAHIDSLTQGSHKLRYVIESESAEDLPDVVDEEGIKYKDKRFVLDIAKDGQKFFRHSFTKADFKSQLSEDFQKHGIMDGLCFNRTEDGKLYFNPDSDMSCPFFLIIGPDGSYAIAPDTSVDEEGLPPTPDKLEEQS